MTTTNEWEIDNLPNRLTIFRILLIPVIILSLYVNKIDSPWALSYHKLLGYVAAWTFVLASITDFFDGYIARKRNLVTVFGSFLDPVADKFLVVSSLILLSSLDRIPVLIVIILVLREMYITTLRLLAREKELVVPVGQLGKWKTALQMVAIPMLMAWDKPYGIPFVFMGTSLIYLASIFSLYSAVQYTFSTLLKLKDKRKQAKKEKKDLSNKSE
jgi:CDP-diacylglycerol--glycerol-3-phosphate 3-phosphatidyltransferase